MLCKQHSCHCNISSAAVVSILETTDSLRSSPDSKCQNEAAKRSRFRFCGILIGRTVKSYRDWRHAERMSSKGVTNKIFMLLMSVVFCLLLLMSQQGESYANEVTTPPEPSFGVNGVRLANQHHHDLLRARGTDPMSLKNLSGGLVMQKDYRDSFKHGSKTKEYQKYIVLHDTEGGGPADGIVNYWDNNGKGVACHFIVDRDGTITQCVDMDVIAHHAGFGDAGHNVRYGVTDESRDDKVGTEPVSGMPDYGMNSYSIGIEMVHVGGQDYPTAQLEALDRLIAHIDKYYGMESEIIDHKAWRTGNSDTDANFYVYLKNYQDHRSYK